MLSAPCAPVQAAQLIDEHDARDLPETPNRHFERIAFHQARDGADEGESCPVVEPRRREDQRGPPPGLAATSLICVIFAWNELMFARVLTSTVAGTSPVFLTGFITSEGLFLAKLCAASLIVSLPVIIAGFAAQDKLVQGLSMGAVK